MQPIQLPLRTHLLDFWLARGAVLITATLNLDVKKIARISVALGIAWLDVNRCGLKTAVAEVLLDVVDRGAAAGKVRSNSYGATNGQMRFEEESDRFYSTLVDPYSSPL